MSHGFTVFRSHDLRPAICINRFRTITHIFIAMNYLMLMLEKDLHSRNIQKHVASKFFSHPVEVIGSMKICFELCVSQRYKQKIERN